jgi:hypothetical protein
LRNVATDGFPTDYLLARVRGRRAALASEWQGLRSRGLLPGESDEGIWEALLQEFEWLHGQMNRGLRARLEPVFVLFELKTVVLCLRNKEVLRSVEIDRLLQHSLLADRLQDALRQEPDVRSAIAAIAEAFVTTPGGGRVLESIYADGGVKGVETWLMHGYLERVAGERLHPAIHGFFVSLIDLRNVVTLYKHLRWGVDDPAAFIPGGTIEPTRLRQASANKDSAYLDALVRGIAGRAAPPMAASEGALETVLLASMTRELRKTGGAGEDVGLILDYIWRVYVHARNRALLLHAGGLGADALERELIA